MNTLSNVLILMIFIYVSLVAGVPGTNTDNVLKQSFFYLLELYISIPFTCCYTN